MSVGHWLEARLRQLIRVLEGDRRSLEWLGLFGCGAVNRLARHGGFDWFGRLNCLSRLARLCWLRRRDGLASLGAHGRRGAGARHHHQLAAARVDLVRLDAVAAAAE